MARIKHVARPPWTTLVLVCSKCEGSREVRARLRDQRKDSKRSDIRILKTSCMNVCPKRKTTIAIASAGEFRTLIVDEYASLETLEL